MVNVRLLSRLMEMIHMMLYLEEVLGARWPERIYTRWPARCHVTRRRAQRDCPSTTPLPTVNKYCYSKYQIPETVRIPGY